MRKQTKFIILIVEGITDQDVYELILTPFLEEKSIYKELRCKCTQGDFFSKKNIEIHNLKNHIRNEVKHYLDTQYLSVNDIEAVIQICDIDGIYIPKTRFKDNKDNDYSYGYNDEGELIRYYDREAIDYLYNIYQKKKQLLEQATRYNHIKINKKEIPYRLFYQSIFLENLIEERFIDSSNKSLKNKIIDDFISHLDNMNNEDIIEFSTRFFKNKLIEQNMSYLQSWTSLNDKNCLSVSNLYFFIEKLIDIV